MFATRTDRKAARRKIQGKLPSLRAQPEPVFATIVVELSSRLPRLDERVVDPTETPFIGTHGARHDTTLILRGHGDLRAMLGLEHDSLAVSTEKREFGTESHGGLLLGVARGLRGLG